MSLFRSLLKTTHCSSTGQSPMLTNILQWHTNSSVLSNKEDSNGSAQVTIGMYVSNIYIYIKNQLTKKRNFIT